MALLQISEPGQSTAPHQHRLAVGIDLGTTNSLVATVRSGDATVLTDADGQAIVPSVVHYAVSGSDSSGSNSVVSVGQAAQQFALTDPLNTISSVKRMLGKSLDEVRTHQGMTVKLSEASTAEAPLLQTAGGDVTSVEVSAEILKQLRRRAEETLGGELVGAVITVPAYFDDAQRQATKDAAKIAGLHVLRLLNEPTAAAIAYGLDKKLSPDIAEQGDEGNDNLVAIYDLGGGTFDISLLRMNRGLFEVLATAGDTALGGDDLDNCLVQWIKDQAGTGELTDPSDIRAVHAAARAAKETLSADASAAINLELKTGTAIDLLLERTQFDELIEPLIRKTLAPCRRVLRDAGVEKSAIKAAVMVGGSTRVPLVRSMVSEFFEQDVLTDINPDEVVAVGAAVQADILAGNKPDAEMLLLDVTPLSLGLETMGGLAEKVIPRNTTIPIARAQEFTTHKDGQTAMALHVVQGEREMVSDCRSLARFELRDIPPMVAGKPRIQVIFQVDADGLLTVSAIERESGVVASVDVVPSYGLSDTQIEEMLLDSMASASEDMQARKLAEQKVDGERVIEALDSALKKDGDQFLDSAERTQLDSLVAALQTAIAGDNADEIKQAVQNVEQGSARYVERRMNASVKEFMAGQSLGDVEETMTGQSENS